MDILFDDEYHLHLGYHQDNCDYESIAFKRKSEDIWDIFFDFKQYGFKYSPSKRINNRTIRNKNFVHLQ